MAPNSLSAYDLLRRAIEQQRAQQPGIDWNSPSLVPEQNPDGDQAPQGVLGRLRALLAEQGQYQPVAGVDESASARPSDPNFRQLSRTPTASQPQAARFDPFLGYAPVPAAAIFATAPSESRATPPGLAGVVRSAADQGSGSMPQRAVDESWKDAEARANAAAAGIRLAPAVGAGHDGEGLIGGISRGILDAYRSYKGTNPRTIPVDRGPYVMTAEDQEAMKPETYVNPRAHDTIDNLFSLPKRALDAAAIDAQHQGEPDYEPQLTGPVLETALIMMGGGVGTIRTTGNAAKTLESCSARLYNPPDKPLRPFEADYPMGVSGEPGSPLLVDNRGTALTTENIVGRRTVGGADEALTPEGLDAAATSLLGKTPEGVAAGSLPRGSVGVYREVRGPDGPERSIVYLKTLDPASAPRVIAHEFGHVLDEFAGRIPTEGLNVELRQLYNTLYTRQERTRYLTGPQRLGYSEADVPRELMAEAIRAYMINPNYIKTVAPKTAARIREYVNNNPRINRVIQFNSGVAGVLGTGAVAGVPRNDDR